MRAFETGIGDRVTVTLTTGQKVTGTVSDCMWHQGYFYFWLVGFKQHSIPYRANDDVTPTQEEKQGNGKTQDGRSD